MATLNQCIDLIESLRRGQTDAGALLDALRAPRTPKVVDLAQNRRGRQNATRVLKQLALLLDDQAKRHKG